MERIGFRKFFIKKWFIFIPIIIGMFFTLLAITWILKEDVKRDKTYTNEKYVALYIKKYNELPKNYLTVHGRDYYFNHDLSLDGYMVGGDTHYNDGKLSNYNISDNTMLKECDLYFDGYDCKTNRGIKRLVYETNTSNTRVFVTYDHYDTFNEITSFEIMPGYYIFLLILTFYCVSHFIFLFCIYIPEVNRLLSEKKEKNQE